MEPQETIKHIPHQYPVVCLCGSTKFKDDFLYWSKWFTLEGCIVVMPMVFGHAGDQITTIQKQELDNLHKAKIKRQIWFLLLIKIIILDNLLNQKLLMQNH